MWQAQAYDAAGQLTEELINGKLVKSNYHVQTGRMIGRTAGSANELYVANYQYDQVGNVILRTNTTPSKPAITENFAFDQLNRLTVYDFTASTATPVSRWNSMEYLANGNIHYKSDVGWYDYGNAGGTPAKPMQLKGVIGSATHSNRNYDFYDANGNQEFIKDGAGNIQKQFKYTAFGLPYEMVVNNGNAGLSGTSKFQYGPELQRVQSIVPDGTAANASNYTKTEYLNGENSLGLSLERITRQTGPTGSANEVIYRHYISAGGHLVAQVDIPENTDPVSLAPYNNTARKYFITDHLGSTAVLLNHDGTTAERSFYDPWGRRINENGTVEAEYSASTANNHASNRGFTNHEHLSSSGLIHMNGRIYDPILGRFMQADPLVPDATNLQAFNRYSYVYNNPLMYTDPSGFAPFWKKKWFKSLAAIGVGFLVAPYASNLVAGLLEGVEGLTYALAGGNGVALTSTGVTLANAGSAALVGFTSGLVASGGDLKASFQGAFIGVISGGLFNAAGQVGANFGDGKFAHYAAHAGAGCLTAVMQGGKCGQGAASAVVSKFATIETRGKGEYVQAFATIVAGGTTSVIGGGKFANGAQSALYV